MRNLLTLATLLAVLSASAAERVFNFSDVPLDQAPPEFHSTVAGKGSPGTWKVVLDDIPPLLAPLSAKGPAMTKRAVLAQVAREPRGEHFPMLLFEPDTYNDFKLSTRFKLAGGAVAQLAGIVFRCQNESNYYALTVSVLDNRFWFFKVVDGVRGPLIGPKIEIEKDAWHEMSAECAGNQIHCLLDGKELIPMLTDNSFGNGKVGFFTMADSVAHFTDAKVTFTPREVLAQKLVRDAVKEYPRLVGLKIFAARHGEKELSIVASKDPKDLGQRGSKTEQDVISRGVSYYGKEKGTVSVTAPLRDRNGDPIAAVQIVLKSFPGETRDAAMVRSQTIIHRMQQDVETLDELVQ